MFRRVCFSLLLGGLVLACGSECVVAQGGNPPGQGGILIDAQGVVSMAPGLKRSETLSSAKLQAAVSESLPADLNRESAMRMISLPALETECERLLAAGEELPDEILYLGGLQRIDYVFVYPETNDLVIGGPADGFAPNGLNIKVGVNSGRPAMRLDDLVLALRSRADTIGCSIDPVQSQLANVNRYLQSVGAASTVSEARGRYQHMVKILGLQNVRVWGVPEDSHFARVLVEADFRMKLLSIGKERSRVRGFKSYLALKEAGTNTMRRWWFAPSYQPLDRTEDRTAWRLNGQRVQLLAQDELVGADGSRSNAAVQKVSTQKFARQFTEKYEQVAERASVFAELQNLFDVAVVAALMRQERLAEQAQWAMSFFTKPDGVPIPTYTVPRQVPSLANSRKAGRLLVVGVVAGGVNIRPRLVVNSMRMNLKPEMVALRVAATRPAAAREDADGTSPNGQRWWWDPVIKAEETVAESNP